MSHATKRWKISTDTSLPVSFRDYNTQTYLVTWVCKQAAQIVPYLYIFTTGDNSVFQGHQSNLTSSGQYFAFWEKVNVFSPLITISEAKSGYHQDYQEQKVNSINKLTAIPDSCAYSKTPGRPGLTPGAIQRQMFSCSAGCWDEGLCVCGRGEEGIRWSREAFGSFCHTHLPAGQCPLGSLGGLDPPGSVLGALGHPDPPSRAEPLEPPGAQRPLLPCSRLHWDTNNFFFFFLESL